MVITASTDTEESITLFETDEPLELLLLALVLLLLVPGLPLLEDEDEGDIASMDDEAIVSSSLIATDFRFLIFREESLPPPPLILLSGEDTVGLDIMCKSDNCCFMLLLFIPFPLLGVGKVKTAVGKSSCFVVFKVTR